MKLRSTLSLILPVFCLHLVSLEAQPANESHWVSTWTNAQPLTRPQPPAGRGGPGASGAFGGTAGRGRGAALGASGAGVAAQGGGRGAQQAIATNGLHDQTIRMIAHTSIGGAKVRVKLSNPFGSTQVDIGAAHVALRDKASAIVGGSDRALTFSGKPTVSIGPGAVILSDPIDLNIPKLSDVAVSLYFPGDTGAPSGHTSDTTSYVSKSGNAAGDAPISNPIEIPNQYWLSGIEVLAPANTSLIVALGDSITEGVGSTVDMNTQWPSLLAARLAANKATANFAVADVGIGGNRLLRERTGASVLSRLDRDVLTQPGVKWIILLEGINDIGTGANNPAEAVTADDLIGACKQIIERAHTAGIKIAGGTLTPFQGAGYYREPGEAVRVAYNTWIRKGGAFDAVIDFEAATRDPQNPERFLPSMERGDHLHPNDAGYHAMADAIDLKIFTAKKK